MNTQVERALEILKSGDSARLEQAVLALPKPYRLVLILRDMEQLNIPKKSPR